MIELVLFKFRHLLSHSVLGSSLAGDGLLVRLRSTSIGLLGVVTAVGLGLIAFIAQLGWPGVFNSPIPGSPREAGAVHDAIALTRPAPPRVEPALSLSAPSQRVGGHSFSRHPSGSDGSSTGAGLAGSRDVSPSVGAQTPPPAVQPAPASAPAPAPTNQPTTTATVTTPPVPSPPATGGPSTSGVTGVSKDQPPSESKPHETAAVKPSDPTGETPEPWENEKLDPWEGEKPKDYWSGRGEHRHYPWPSKSGSYSPGKPGDTSPEALPETSTPPEASIPPKDESKGGGFTEGKDAGYAGKSDKRHH